MKHIFICILACSILGLFSCQEDEVETWQGEDGVYFYVQWGVDWYDTTYWAAQPYTEVNFTSFVFSFKLAIIIQSLLFPGL